MAQFSAHVTGRIDELVGYIEDAVKRGSISASMEGGSDMTEGGLRCVVRVFERYSYAGCNRLSLSVILFGRDDDIRLTAITSGGSQGMFIKINTWGEKAFLDKFRDQLDAYTQGSVRYA